MGDGWEASSREARSLGPGLEGIMEAGCQALCGGEGEGQEEQERGPRAFQALGLEGPPQIHEYKSVTGQESKPLAGSHSSRFPISFGLRNITAKMCSVLIICQVLS